MLPELNKEIDNISLQIYESIIGNGSIPSSVLKALRAPDLDRYGSDDIEGFFLRVKAAIDDRISRAETPEPDRLLFLQDTPPTDLTTETVTYKVSWRVPGAHSGSITDIINRSLSLKREWRPRLREELNDPEFPNQRIAVMGQSFDNMVEFTCWAATNKAADDRAFWFEDLMRDYHWYFKYVGGFKEIVFVKRLEDSAYEAREGQGNLLKSRTLQYFVKTDRTYKTSTYLLRDMLLNVAVTTK